MYTKDKFVQSYLLLGSPDPVIKNQANHYIMELLEHDEAWLVSKELLESANLEHMFFGAQILHQKTQYSFGSLEKQAQNELRSYVYALFIRLCDQKISSRPVLSKIASTAAVIGCSMISEEWPTFLQDLVGIMKKSLWHLRACLQVIDFCTDAIKNLRGVRHAEREYVRTLFMQRQDLLFQIFNDVFQVEDLPSLTRNLECIESWCKFSLPAMKNPTLIKNVLRVCLQSEESFDLAGEIIVSCFSQINCASIREVSASIVLKSQLDANQLDNLAAIVNFLITHINSFYGPGNCQPSGDRVVTKASSHLCCIYSFIVQRVLVDYPWVATQDTGNTSGRLLLSSMVTALKHRSIEVSDKALELFYLFYSQVTKLKDPLAEDFKQVLLNCYIEVHRIVLSRSQRSRLLGDLVAVQEETMEEDEEDEGAGDIFKITFSQYRKDCREFFVSAYEVFKELAGKGGASYFFEPILALLQPSLEDTLGSNKIQAALFAVSSCMISLASDGSNKSYLQTILTYVCSKIGPNTNPNVRAESFRLLSNCSKEVNTNPELFKLVVRHLLQAVDNSKVGLEAVNSMASVVELCKEHQYFDLVQAMVGFYSTGFSAVTHEAVLQKFINAMIQFGLSIASADGKRSVLQTILGVLHKRLCAALQNTAELWLRAKQLEDIAGVLEQLLTSNKYLEQVSTVAAFVNQVFDIVRQMLQVCEANGGQFDSQTSTTFDVCVRSLKNTYPLLLKTALACFPDSLQPSFLLILEQGIKLFIAHPITNSAMLNFWSNTLEEYSKRSLRNDQLDSWLVTTYSSFCDYCVGSTNNGDPDVIKNCYQVHLAMLNYSSQLFWNSGKAPLLYQIALQALCTLNQRTMQKIIIFFLQQLVRQSTTVIPNNRLDFMPLLKVLFSCIPQLNPLTFIPCAHILCDLLPQFPQPQFVLQELLKGSESFKVFPQPRIILLSKALELYVKTKDERNIKSTLIGVSNMASSNLHDSDTWMSIELNYERNSRAYRTYLKNQQAKN